MSAYTTPVGMRVNDFSISLEGEHASSIERFIDEFFSLCAKPRSEIHHEKKVIDLLRTLHEAGYTIDHTKIVFGRHDASWPLMKREGGVSILCGMSTGVRGSFGSGCVSLVEYLESLARQLQAREKTTSVFHDVAPAPAASEPPQSLKISRAVPTSSAGVPSSAFNLAQLFRPGDCMVYPSSLPLSTLRSFGIFTSLPPRSVNNFTEEQLLNTKLTVFQNGNLLLTRKGQILACSPGMKFLPSDTDAWPGTIMYVAKDGSYTDRPCADPFTLEFPLNDRAHLAALLPYLQGIPPYHS